MKARSPSIPPGAGEAIVPEATAPTEIKEGAHPIKLWLMGLLLVAGVLIAYAPAFRAGYIWDDNYYVTENRLLTAPDGLWRIWFSFDSPSQYFPLVYTTFRLEHALWGLAPFGYHTVNILLHGINALLLWRVLSRLKLPGAWLAAAIFALHPVQVESVAWVTELKNVQMGFFFLLSVLAWLQFSDATGKARWRFYALSLAFYALSLFSKTTACTMPAALLVIVWIRGERITREKLAQIVPYGVMGVGMGVLTILWERYHQGSQGAQFQVGIVARILICARGVWFYLFKLIWPAKLTFSYPRWDIGPGNVAAWIGLLALFGLAWLAWRERRRIGIGPIAALLFFVAMLGPVLGLVMLYTFRYTFVADHYQYLACIGPIVLVCVAMEQWALRFTVRDHWLAQCGPAVLVLTLGALTWRQAAIYKDPETLWRATLARNPASWMAWNNLGHLLYGRGLKDEAVADYQASLKIKDNGEAHDNYGIVLKDRGDIDGATREYERAIALDPSDPVAYYDLGVVKLTTSHPDQAVELFQKSLRLNPSFASAHTNYGDALISEGHPEEAIEQFQEALRLDPDSSEARCNLGNLLLSQGRLDEAMAQYEAALKSNPKSATAHYNKANALSSLGQRQQAEAEYQAALQYEPAMPEANNNLGTLLLQDGDARDAIPIFEAALRANPFYAEAQGNLGTAFLKSGRVEEAIAAIRRALRLQPDNPQIENNLAWLLATAPGHNTHDRQEAVYLASNANKTAGGENAAILRTLAVALAGAGDYRNATLAAHAALTIAASSAENSRLVPLLTREMKLYQASQPYSPAN